LPHRESTEPKKQIGQFGGTSLGLLPGLASADPSATTSGVANLAGKCGAFVCKSFKLCWFPNSGLICRRATPIRAPAQFRPFLSVPWWRGLTRLACRYCVLWPGFKARRGTCGQSLALKEGACDSLRVTPISSLFEGCPKNVGAAVDLRGNRVFLGGNRRPAKVDECEGHQQGERLDRLLLVFASEWAPGNKRRIEIRGQLALTPALSPGEGRTGWRCCRVARGCAAVSPNSCFERS
jgi:hypothetical protein